MPLELGKLNRHPKTEHTCKEPPGAGALLLQMASHTGTFPCHPVQCTLERSRQQRTSVGAFPKIQIMPGLAESPSDVLI